MKQLSWRHHPSSEFKILYINEGAGWVPYTAHPVASTIESRQRPAGDKLHSKGWFAYQHFFLSKGMRW